jgi:enoyl-CoA hydratase
MTDDPAVRVERDGAVAVLALQRPARYNALTVELKEALLGALGKLASANDVRALVLTGAGKAFCVGADFSQMEENLARGGYEDGHPGLMTGSARMARSILAVRQPMIAAVNGHAIGLGATLALFCDLIIAADSARIGDPHVRVGLVAGDGGAVIWPLLVGYARAKQYLLGGDLLSAADAQKIGLINVCVPAAELDGVVEKWAARLAGGARNAIQWTKATINIALKDQAVKMLDAGLAYEMSSLRSDDHLEAIRAFQEKRKPNFTGR